jgi:ABC-2 type transport system permease protein
MRNIYLVAKREFFSRIKKWTFWISTLAFPAFIIIVALVSGASSASVGDQGIIDFDELENPIVIQDNSEIILDESKLGLPEQVNIRATEDTRNSEYIDQVETGELEAYIVIPRDILESDESEIRVYQQDQGIFGNQKFIDFTNQLFSRSAQAQIESPETLTLLNSNFSGEITAFEDGEKVSTGIEALVPTAISLVVYLVLVMTGAGYMLQSVSEEKENRMIEVILAAISARELIWGKILGLVAVVITQLITLIGLSIIPMLAFGNDLPIDVSTIEVDPLQLIVGIIYIFLGFFTLSAIMVGIAGAMPNYKEAQSFSSLFYIAAVFPLYLATVLLAEPSGSVATGLSYLPVFGPLVILIRNALGAMSPGELLVTTILNLGYVIAAMYIAFLLFKLGSLRYNQKLNPLELMKR